MTKYLLKITPTTLLLFPLIAFAQQAGAINNIIIKLQNLFTGPVISLIFILATLIFLWGVVQYVAKGHDEAAQKKAKGLMLWGIIGLAVMLGVWGIVNLLIQYFGIGGQGIPSNLPSI